jgi:pimeloyl-ACP methyl ester carboxylesterase
MGYLRSIIELENGIAMEQFSPSKGADKTPLLFVHGNFSGSWCFYNLMAYFAERGAPCYAVNFRGHWLSSGHAALGEAVTEDYVADVETCLAAIGEQVNLLGHSMGGLVGQLVAAKTDKVANLVLLDSAPCKAITETYFQARPGIGQTLHELYQYESDQTVHMKKNKDRIKAILFEKEKVSAETLAQTVTFLGRESAEVVRAHPFIPVDPAAVSCPVYVLAREGLGNEEQPDLWQAVADYYNAKDRYISGEMSHNMFMETDWEDHAARIEKWLA